MSYGFIYITTNNITGKKYIGQCSGDTESSNVKRYFGSGKAILRSIKKHGIENFSKDIISYHNTLEELNEAERSLIKELDAVNSKQFYNIAPGGRASLGFTGKKHSKERNLALSEKMKSDSFNHPIAKSITIDGTTYKSISEAKRKSKYTHRQIDRFISSGIHPNLQTNKPPIPKTRNSGFVWYFTEESSGNLISKTDLRRWIDSIHISEKKLLATKENNTFYNGLQYSHRIKKSQLKSTV